MIEGSLSPRTDSLLRVIYHYSLLGYADKEVLDEKGERYVALIREAQRSFNVTLRNSSTEEKTELARGLQLVTQGAINQFPEYEYMIHLQSAVELANVWPVSLHYIDDETGKEVEADGYVEPLYLPIVYFGPAINQLPDGCADALGQALEESEFPAEIARTMRFSSMIATTLTLSEPFAIQHISQLLAKGFEKNAVGEVVYKASQMPTFSCLPDDMHTPRIAFIPVTFITSRAPDYGMHYLAYCEETEDDQPILDLLERMAQVLDENGFNRVFGISPPCPPIRAQQTAHTVYNEQVINDTLDTHEWTSLTWHISRAPSSVNYDLYITFNNEGEAKDALRLECPPLMRVFRKQVLNIVKLIVEMQIPFSTADERLSRSFVDVLRARYGKEQEHLILDSE